MKTRIFTLLVAFLTMVGNAVWGQDVWDGTTDVSWYNENQTEFTITTAEQLAGLAELVNNQKVNFLNKTINLNADITLNANSEDYKNWATTPPQNEWTTIGSAYYNPKFSGTFNGNNHTIKGVYIKDTNEEDYLYVGLFGTGSIQNLKVIQSYIEKEGNAARIFVGGITGGGGNISNCGFDGLIVANISGTVSELGIGGICADIYNTQSGKIESCYTSGEIKVSLNNIQLTGTGLCYIAGIGMAKEISNSYNTADISVNINGVKGSNSLGMNIVTISGIGNANDIASCYNTGDMIVSGGETGNENTVVVGLGGILGSGGNSIQYCYSIGTMTTSNFVKPTSAPNLKSGNLYGEGSILGLDQSMPEYPDYQFQFLEDYYLDNTKAVGGNVYDASISYEEKEGLDETTEIQFANGEVAWLLRDAGFGQNLQDDNITSPTLLAFTPNATVYKLTLNYESYDETTAAEQYANSGYLNLPELEENAGWYDGEGNLYTSESAISEDITLYAQKKTARTITIVDTDGGTVASDKTTAIVGETITLTVTTNEGYTFGGLSVMGTEAIETTLTGENTYTFTMPDADVTVTAQFTKDEEPTDPDEGDDEQGGIVPDAPKYYNIYEDEICEGVTVEFSRDVVKEGQSVFVTVKVEEGFDTTKLALKFKRALFGYWEDLTLTPTENPNEYIIKNIYTDIYVRAEGAVPTGIESIDGAKVYTKDESIYVYTPAEEEVTIISMSGAVLKNESQVGLKQYTGLQRGIYIICIDEARFKVRL